MVPSSLVVGPRSPLYWDFVSKILEKPEPSAPHGCVAFLVIRDKAENIFLWKRQPIELLYRPPSRPGGAAPVALAPK